MTYALHLKRAGLLGVPNRFKCLGCLLESALLVFDGRAGPSQRPAAASSVKGASQRSQRCSSEAWRSFTREFRQGKLTYSVFQQGTKKSLYCRSLPLGVSKSAFWTLHPTGTLCKLESTQRAFGSKLQSRGYCSELQSRGYCTKCTRTTVQLTTE